MIPKSGICYYSSFGGDNAGGGCAEKAVKIRRHDRSYLVELSDTSAWRIWPADISKTLMWLPTTEIDVVPVAHQVCSYALVDRADGSLVRVIKADMEWPVDTVRQLLSIG